MQTHIFFFNLDAEQEDVQTTNADQQQDPCKCVNSQ